MNLGEYVNRRRKALGLSQSTLAASLSYSDQAISKFEAGESLPSLSVIPSLANLLQLSVDDLLTRNENPLPFEEKNPPFINRQITENLYALRLAHKLSQKEEADIFKVSRRTIINYENGASLPSLDVLDRILDFYKLKPHAFFYEVLYPDIQETRLFKSHSFQKTLGIFVLGFVMGGALLSGILTPVLLNRSSSGEYNVPNNSQAGNSSVTNTTSLGIPYLEKLVVITTQGFANAARLPSGGSLGITVYGGPLFALNEEAKSHYQVDYWLSAKAPSGVSLEYSLSYPCVLLKAASGTAYSQVSPFLVFAKITSIEDPSISVTTNDPIEITLSAPEA